MDSLGRKIETVEPKCYRYTACCTHPECRVEMGHNDVSLVRSLAEAHASSTKHSVAIYDRGGE